MDQPLGDKLTAAMKDAMRAKDTVTLNVLSALKSAIKYAGIQGDGVDLEPGRSVLFGETRFTLNSIHLS